MSLENFSYKDAVESDFDLSPYNPYSRARYFSIVKEEYSDKDDIHTADDTFDVDTLVDGILQKVNPFGNVIIINQYVKR